MPRSEDRGTIAGRATIAGRKRRSGRRRGGRMKHQRKAVHAVAQPGRLRPIVEDVTEMAAAGAEVNFGPQHPEGPVFGLADGVLERLVKARPAGAALEFRLRGEQRQVAAGAGEDALAMLLEQRARTRALGALLAQNLILLRRQLRAPFRIGLFDFEFLRGVRRRRPQPPEGGKPKQTGDGGEQDTAVNHDGLRRSHYGSFAFKYGARQQKLHWLGRKFLTFLRGIVPRMQRSALGSTLRAARAQAPWCTPDRGPIHLRVGPGSAVHRKGRCTASGTRRGLYPL